MCSHAHSHYRLRLRSTIALKFTMRRSTFMAHQVVLRLVLEAHGSEMLGAVVVRDILLWPFGSHDAFRWMDIFLGRHSLTDLLSLRETSKFHSTCEWLGRGWTIALHSYTRSIGRLGATFDGARRALLVLVVHLATSVASQVWHIGQRAVCRPRSLVWRKATRAIKFWT